MKTFLPKAALLCAGLILGASCTAGRYRQQRSAPAVQNKPSLEAAPVLTSHRVAAAPGEPQTAALFALLAEKASKELGRTVTVKINHRRQLDGWIFLAGVPREPAGAPLDYRSTLYAQPYAEGLVDDVLLALARRTDGGWELLAFSLGATDAPFFDWSERYGAPLSLFSDQGD